MRTLKSLVITLLLATSFSHCTPLNPQDQDSRPLSHELWDQLLKKHVDDEGMVDYKGFSQDSSQLKIYLKGLSENAPNGKHWSEADQLAYWINAYNAFTIDLVLKHYPVESIKDIGPSIQIPLVNTPWQIKFIEINGEKYNLDNLEHNIIRKNFNEPRIHFALVCAAISCPKLRNEAYNGHSLDQQLTDQTRAFLSNENKNRIAENKIEISKIFKWYGGDFKKETSLIQYLNQYTEVTIRDNAKVSYTDYDWGLNVRE